MHVGHFDIIKLSYSQGYTEYMTSQSVSSAHLIMKTIISSNLTSEDSTVRRRHQLQVYFVDPRRNKESLVVASVDQKKIVENIFPFLCQGNYSIKNQTSKEVKPSSMQAQSVETTNVRK